MQRLEVSGAVRPIYGSLGVKQLSYMLVLSRDASHILYLVNASRLCVARDVSIFCKMRSSVSDVGSGKRHESINDVCGPRSLCNALTHCKLS